MQLITFLTNSSVKLLNIREKWYKMFVRWYITPKDIGKVDKNYKDKCSKLIVSGRLLKKQKDIGRKCRMY